MPLSSWFRDHGKWGQGPDATAAAIVQTMVPIAMINSCRHMERRDS